MADSADHTMAPQACPGHLTDMLEGGRITQADFDKLKSVICRDCRDTVVRRVYLDGNVTLYYTEGVEEIVAAHHVLNLPELLESILSNVPPLQLLYTGQRVCKAFQHTIRTSPTIRRSLQLEYDPTVGRTIFPLRVVGIKEITDDWRAWPYGNKEGEIIDFGFKLVPSDLHSSARTSETFRSMLIAQPPVHDMVIDVATDGPSVTGLRLHNENGVTFGRVLDVVDDLSSQRILPGWTWDEKGMRVRVWGDWPTTADAGDTSAE